MRIVADENIACLDQTFGNIGELHTVAGRALDRSMLGDAQALIVRSVTRVDAALLDNSAVQFVGSCTIGTDHIDLEYLRRRGIEFAHAPGCNAQAVAEYVIAAIFSQLGELNCWQHKRVGILGYGNVGRRVANLLDVLGVQWRACDPFIDQRQAGIVAFDDFLACDILTLHTPLTRDGAYPTYHLFDELLLQKLDSTQLLINAARGAVISGDSLQRRLRANPSLKVALDVFENEPGIDVQLLQHLKLVTPHVAGYSVQGKEQGTRMVFDALCRWQGITPQHFNGALPQTLDCLSLSDAAQIVIAAVGVEHDDADLRQAKMHNIATVFDALRKNYRARHEWKNLHLINVDRDSVGEAGLQLLQRLGFTLA